MKRSNRFGGILAAIFVLVLLTTVGFAAFQWGLAEGAASAFIEQRGELVPNPYMYGPFFWGWGFGRFILTVILLIVVLRVVIGVGFRAGFRRRWAHAGRGDWNTHIREVHNRLHEEEAGGSPPQGASDGR